MGQHNIEDNDLMHRWGQPYGEEPEHNPSLRDDLIAGALAVFMCAVLIALVWVVFR